MVGPEVFLYPVRGAAPYRCIEGGDHFLHAGVSSTNGWPQMMGFGESIRQPGSEHPLVDKVRGQVQVSTDGVFPVRDHILIDPNAELTKAHFDAFSALTHDRRLEIGWEHFTKGDASGVRILTDPDMEYPIHVFGADNEPFRAPAFSIVLASLRALALQNTVTKN